MFQKRPFSRLFEVLQTKNFLILKRVLKQKSLNKITTALSEDYYFILFPGFYGVGLADIRLSLVVVF